MLGAGLAGYDPTVGHCGAWALAPNAGTLATGRAVVVASRYSSCVLRSSAVIDACAQMGAAMVSAAMNTAAGKKEVMEVPPWGDALSTETMPRRIDRPKQQPQMFPERPLSLLRKLTFA